MTAAALTVASVIGVWTLFLVLAIYAMLILRELRATGGTPTSLLARIRLGRRAIEVHCRHIEPELTRLNRTLELARDAFRAIDANPAGTPANGREE
jgi:hypothetical protein